jgi:filamentous hemagglutinin
MVDNVIINPHKLTHYALDPQSPKGKHKAIVFERLGFTKENYTELLKQLQTKSWTTEANSYGEDEYGKRYTLEIMIETPTGQLATVVTGWLVPKNTREAHLVTLYVKT